jgi:MFS family permease
MDSTRRNVFLLACCQALLLTNNVTLIAMNGLAGYMLATDKMLATLPATFYIIGAAASTIPSSLLMKRIGRRRGFLAGCLFGIVGAAIATFGIYTSSFWTLCAGTLVLGTYNAFGQYYRFAAADAAHADFKAKAISYVLAGGLVGGIIGPELSKYTRDASQPPFLLSYASLMVFCLVAMAILARLHIPEPKQAESMEPPRPMAEIMAQPVFLVAVIGAALGYGAMNLLMTATPLAMGFCGHPYSAAASVISAHVIAMFGPSFFTGSLIKRFGVLAVMFTGAILMVACVMIGLSGQLVSHFMAALVLLGAGWNFLYVGGTTLMTEAYRPNERAKTQGMNEILIFTVTATSSFASGVLVNAKGWNTLNWVALPMLVTIVIALGWLALRRRNARAVAAA